MLRVGLFKEVYEIVARIPYGHVMTYGQIALMLGNPRLARRVGQAMFAVPDHLQLPAHRVVHADGGLCEGHEFGQLQRQLLVAEGISFLPSKDTAKPSKVDLAKHRWIVECGDSWK